MIVVDPGVVVEVILATPVGTRAAERLLARGEDLHAPHLLDVEVGQVVRRFERAGRLSAARATECLQDLLSLPIQRHAHDLLLPLAWARRGYVGVQGGVYLALAELLGCALVTADRRLQRAEPQRVELLS